MFLILSLLFFTSCAADELTLFVSAKHFDYHSCEACLKSLAKTKDGRFGHAWIRLEGPYTIEGGHSGELGLTQPRYFDGVAALVEAKDPNPIRYLWEGQQDGFFQQESGGHKPTFMARKTITREQFEKIAAFIRSYPFSQYSLTGNQCCSFVVAVAALADWPLDATVSIRIPSTIYFRGLHMRLWTDSRYATLTFCTPDQLEQSLRKK